MMSTPYGAGCTGIRPQSRCSGRGFARDDLGEHRRHGVTELDPLVGRRPAEGVAVVEGLKPGGLAERDRPSLDGVDVAVPVLREVRDDGLRGAVPAEPRVLVVE